MNYTIFGETHPTETRVFMTLNDLLNLSKQYPEHKFKLIGTDLSILEVVSWRGSYDIPSICPSHKLHTGQEIADELESKIGSIMYGYKGGEYIIYGDDEFYVSNWGSRDEYKIFHYEVEADSVILYTDIDEH